MGYLVGVIGRIIVNEDELELVGVGVLVEKTGDALFEVGLFIVKRDND